MTLQALRPLRIEPLEREAFAPFGEVIAVEAAARHFIINDGNTVRYHDLANIDPGKDGRPIVSIFRGQPRQLPFAVKMLERHPLASQAFIPLSGLPYLIVVAPAGEQPADREMRAFRAEPGQGVNYTAGVWHHPLLALGAVSDFIVIDRAGPGQNCDEVMLDEPRLLKA